MTTLMFPAVLLAGFWGVLWALFLWLTAPGRFLRLRRTWITVVVGLGVDLLFALLVVDVEVWLQIVAIIGASAVGIIGFAVLMGEYGEHREDLDDARHEGR